MHFKMCPANKMASGYSYNDRESGCFFNLVTQEKINLVTQEKGETKWKKENTNNEEKK